MTDNDRLNEDADLGSPLQAIVLPPSDRIDPATGELLVRSREYTPFTELMFSENNAQSKRGIGNLAVEYRPWEWLKLNVEGGVDYLDLDERRYQGPQTLDGAPNGLSRLSQTTVFNYTGNGYLTYENFFGDHVVSAVAGGSFQQSDTENIFRRGRGLTTDQLEGISEQTDSVLNRVTNTGFRFLSFFSRVNYSFRHKYMIQLSGRMDGSSKFGTNNRYGIFPAVSVGWNLANEQWFIDNDKINTLKLKGSYGQVGNAPEDNFLFRTEYIDANFGNEEGLRPSNLSNPDLKWETTTQIDIGLDFAFFENRFNGSLNVYRKLTDDLLFPLPVTQTSGFSFVLENIAKLENEGIEVALGGVPVKTENFTWSIDFNMAYNQNEITDLDGRNVIAGVNAFLEGEPAGVFYMRRYAGVDPDTGFPLYDDGNGGTTTDFESAPRQVVGDPNPDYFGGLNNTFTFKNFDLSFLIQGVMGLDVYRATGEFLSNSGILLYNQTADQLDRWYAPGDQADVPGLDPFLVDIEPSTRWLEDGSYLRLKNFSLGYNFSEDLVANWSLRYVRVYIGGQNLYTLTRYTGYDPEVSYVLPEGGTAEENISQGNDNFTTPQPRVFTVGLKVGF